MSILDEIEARRATRLLGRRTLSRLVAEEYLEGLVSYLRGFLLRTQPLVRGLESCGA